MKMKIETRDFGEIEIDESTIINIPEGIIGFESVKRFEISDDEQELLKLDENTPYTCLAVAIVPDDYKQTTINLRCPIVLNLKDNIAAQVMLEDYDFKYPVYSKED